MKKVVLNHPAIIEQSGNLRPRLIIAKVKEMSVSDLKILIQLLPNTSSAKQRVQSEIYIKSSPPEIASIFRDLEEQADPIYSRGTMPIYFDEDNSCVGEEDEGKLIH